MAYYSLCKLCDTEKMKNFDRQDFLKNYWQKKYLLISQAFPDFVNPVDADTLAGLSLEEGIESRIILEDPADTYAVFHGPFSEDYYQQLPRKNWTLLVQAVDHYVDTVAALKKYFEFLPRWRLDDLMISYAPQGGSVGAHFDQYDVFLIQASGQRRWNIGQFCDETTPLVDNAQVKLLKAFEQKESYLVSPGDVLYVPPGCAHWGVSESDDCMTISVGFRAPSAAELIADTCDEMLSEFVDSERYRDVGLLQAKHASEISQASLEHVYALVQKHMLSKESIARVFGKLMTRPKYEQDVQFIARDGVEKSMSARMAYIALDEGVVLFANGQQKTCALMDEAFIQSVCDSDVVQVPETSSQRCIVDFLIGAGVYD